LELEIMRTFMAKKEEIERKWYVIDATDQILGKLAVAVAKLLMGKNKPIFTRHVDCGDFVVVVNAEKVRVTGKKAQNKTYESYSGYPGGRKVRTFEYMIKHRPRFVIREAVRRMLPKNKLARQMLKKLKVYKETEHKHEAQKPESITIADVK
jgi:large subunit ribosomal protein L13